MDIKLTDKSLRYFLKTDLKPTELALKVSLCGPTFDRLHETKNDTVYDIEVITNRVDTASAQGIARDSAAILKEQGLTAKLINDPYSEKIDLYSHLGKTFSFKIENDSLVPAFAAVSLSNISVKPSPTDTQDLLTLCGERPINNIVDITNELTLLYGMPSHIFDLDKLGAQSLTIRESKNGEKVITLDGQTNELKGHDLVIEDGTGQLVDLCGIMGGQVAEVDEHTKNLLLIVPVYEPSKIRRSSLYLQKRTLASQIYEKQPDPELCLPVLTRALALFKERSGAQVSSSVFYYQPSPKKAKEINLDLVWLSEFIGVTIPTAEVISILNDLGFATEKQKDTAICCTVPSWRYHDINIKEDLAEEIARVYGYYRLPSVLPCVNLLPEPQNSLLKTENEIKTILSNQGFHEIYNSSLVSQELVTDANLQIKDHLELKNALSTDYKYLRTSLVPSLLQNIKNNQGKTDEPYLLYEISNAYLKTKERLPSECSQVVIATTIEYRQTKGILESLLTKIKVNSRFSKAKQAPLYFHQNKTGEILCQSTVIGHLGFIEPNVLHNFGITSDPIIVEIDTQKLVSQIADHYSYEPISEYPEVSESVAVSSSLPIGDIITKISSVDPLVKTVSYLETYQNKHSFKISLVSQSKNLTQKDADIIKEKIKELFP